jgi:restriction system protein
MKNYYRVMLGRKSMFYEMCLDGEFIGADFGLNTNLTNHLYENSKEFNKKYVPEFLKARPDKTKVGAGLGCGVLWTVCKGIKVGDIVLCPDGGGSYLVGEVSSEYQYVEGAELQHQRKVKWYKEKIPRNKMSEDLRNSSGSIGTICNITKYEDEIKDLIDGKGPAVITTNDETIEDPSVFAMEKHLEEFLVKNWHSCELSKDYDIYEEDGELIGQQYETDSGHLDILAISKDKKTLLVIELKKGRTSDVVVGQILRYMGFVQDELAEPEQVVKGLIIAFDEDYRLKRALSMTKNIDFYCYRISFSLNKVA